MKPEMEESSNRLILEPIIDPSNIENFLNGREVPKSKEKHREVEREF